MITIIGAGPAGLAIGYCLQQQQQPFHILERGSVGWSWQHHYDSVRLHTLKQNSALPGLPMPTDYPDFASRQQVVDYLRRYATHFDLPIEEGVEVERAWHANGRWHLQTSIGPRQTDTLIVATGIWSTPVQPALPGLDGFRGETLHGRDYRNPAPFHNRRVLVVGAGNTGCEIAAELGNAGVETGLVVRSGVAFVPYPTSPAAMTFAAWFTRTFPHLSDPILRRTRPDFSEIGLPPPAVPPTQTFPVVGFDLPEAVRAGAVTVYPEIECVEANGVRFADGRFAAIDAILFATGYRPTLDFLDPVPELDEYGRVAHPSQFPNLHVLGMHYPNTEGWLQSIGRFARRLAAQINTTP